MTASINFSFPDAPRAVDALGASAESLLYRSPDLALLRVRQLVEVFVAFAVSKGPALDLPPREDTIGAAIGALRPEHLRGVTNSALRAIVRTCNSAVHHKSLGPRDPMSHARDAREQLIAVHAVWSTWLGSKRAFSWPPASAASAQALAELHASIDGIEERVNRRRDLAAAQELDRLPKAPLGVTERDRQLLALRFASVRLAAANHDGAPVSAPDPLAAELLRHGDGYAKDEALQYLNRVAVGHLNELACDEALSVLQGVVEWRQASATFLPEDLSTIGATDRTLGALLGTQAQALTMKAYADRDLGGIDRAVRAFRAARECFLEADDVQRQDVYLCHALLDRARISGSLPGEDRARIADLITQRPPDDFAAGSPSAAFHVALALKAHFLFQLPYGVEAVNQAMSALLPRLLARDGRLPHPYENIAGWLLMSRGGASQPLRAALAASAAPGARGEAGTVIGWIAQTFLSDATKSAAPEGPGRLAAWSRRIHAARALDVLPFNYA